MCVELFIQIKDWFVYIKKSVVHLKNLILILMSIL